MKDNKLDERLGMKLSTEFKKQLAAQASEKGLKTSTYARMKLKEAV